MLLPIPTRPAVLSPPSIDDFEVLLLIGQGASSKVFLVRDKETKKLYALKQAPTWDQSADIVQEQEILKSIAHLPDAPASLLPLVGSWTDSEYSYLLTVSPICFTLITLAYAHLIISHGVVGKTCPACLSMVEDSRHQGFRRIWHNLQVQSRFSSP